MKIYSYSFLPLFMATPHTKRQAQNTIIDDILSAVQYYSIPNEVLNHGCHCQSLENIPSHGMPIDNRDNLCRSWSSARSCTFLNEGPCSGVIDTSYHRVGTDTHGDDQRIPSKLHFDFRNVTLWDQNVTLFEMSHFRKIWLSLHFERIWTRVFHFENGPKKFVTLWKMGPGNLLHFEMWD